MKTVIICCAILLISCGYSQAEDCTKGFPVGEYGIPQSDSIVASGSLYGNEFEPVYMKKQRVDEEGPDACRYVYTFDIFRLKLKKEEGFLFAGCWGDFNGDGKRDYALLLRSIADQKIQLRVFIQSINDYRVVPIWNPVDFNDDHPIPICIRKPSDGTFIGIWKEKYKVIGDLINYGWYTYF